LGNNGTIKNSWSKFDSRASYRKNVILIKGKIMLNPIFWQDLTSVEQKHLLQRPNKVNNADNLKIVQQIIDTIQKEGDVAIKKFTKQFDQVEIDKLQVSKDEIDKAYQNVDATTLQAIEESITRLSHFHMQQKTNDFVVETAPEVICGYLTRPIEKIGLYVPGGNAPLISTVLMLGIPAQIAGCPVKILCSPPNKYGDIDPNILVAANYCGIDKIYKIGGAQAIAAMAYGTETITKVDKIYGPGNSWVTQAKILVAQDPAGAAIDLPAGPSELLIIADDLANPNFIAADLLSQAEHGVDSQIICICLNSKLANQINESILAQLQDLPTRFIAEKSLNNCRLIITDNIDSAISISNQYAPEHLILQIENAKNYINKIQNAGSIFLGPWSPESAGDYTSGTNHVLPTGGFAKNTSGLGLKDFTKTISFQELTKNGLKNIAKSITTLATLENLIAHRRAVEWRINT
jgi:histidinol dehydrogenase